MIRLIVELILNQNVRPRRTDAPPERTLTEVSLSRGESLGEGGSSCLLGVSKDDASESANTDGISMVGVTDLTSSSVVC